MSYTKGPWHRHKAKCWYHVKDERNYYIAQNVFSDADAYLLASAPDLLEAAKEALTELYRVSPSLAAPKLRAAIAKAEGK